MSAKQKNAIKPSREEDYAEWYQEVIKEADLAEHSSIRGCMVIKPWGYGIWENMQKILNEKIKKTGHQNAYFPLFVPLSLFEKEAEHVEGFAKECAVVTHTRLEKNKEGKLVPVDKLETPLIVRPTSEMIIGQTFAKWIESYRDLPLLINQWANIVRWEMRPRLFLRTTEFLWQEGHTVHATSEEADNKAKEMLSMYTDFSENILAMPSVSGIKTESDKFPGAVATYTFEAMMQDKKALQGGTSHFLGQNFSKSCDIKFTSEKGQEEFGWMTSWGVTSRLIGAVIMTHSDDDGLVLPPKIAPAHVVLLPVIHNEEMKSKVLSFCQKLADEMQKQIFGENKIEVIIDSRDIRGGEKKWQWIKKGIPLRIEIGPRDMEKNNFPIARRDKAHNEYSFLSKEDLIKEVQNILEDIQKNIFYKAKQFMQDNIFDISTKDELYSFFTPKNTQKAEIHGGFALCHLADTPENEKILKEDLSVSFRCLPFDLGQETGKCLFTGTECAQKVLVAKSY